MKFAAIFLSVLTIIGCSTEKQNRLVYDIIDNYNNSVVVTDVNFAEKFRKVEHMPRISHYPWGSDSPRLMLFSIPVSQERKEENSRRSIYIGAEKGKPVKIEIPLNIGEKLSNSELRFSLAGLKLRGSSADFRISFFDGKNWTKLSEYRKSDIDKFEEKWQDFRLKLPDGKKDKCKLTLEFSAESGEPNLFLANPQIWKISGEKRIKPNVVLIIIDAARFDSINAIHNEYNLTPNMDMLSADGAVFKNQFTNANWTRPSTIAIFTGDYASSSGINLYYPPVSQEEKNYFYKESGLKPITHSFRKNGYITRSISQNAFILDYNGIGVDLNFDELTEYETEVRDTIDITNESINWLQIHSDDPFMLLVNYNGPHGPYNPPKEFIDKVNPAVKDPVMRSYFGEIAYTDYYLGKLIDKLKELGIYENTVIAVTSDHGEILNKARGISPYTGRPAFWSHGQTQLDEELHVPLIIKPAAGKSFDRTEVAELSRSIDIAPTLCELAGVRFETVTVSGKSLLGLVNGKEKESRVVYSEGRLMFSVRTNEYKYTERFLGFGLKPYHWRLDETSGLKDGIPGYKELFDLQNDPAELNNLAGNNKAIEKKMSDLLHNLRFKQPENIIMASENTFRGRLILESGFFYDMKLEDGKGEIRKIKPYEIEFKLKKGESLSFQTIPSYPKIKVELDSGFPLLTGHWLLPLAERLGERSWRIDSALKCQQGEPPMNLLAYLDKSLLYWNIPSQSGMRGVNGEAYVSRDINQLLQNWGYIQGKEKKDN